MKLLSAKWQVQVKWQMGPSPSPSPSCFGWLSRASSYTINISFFLPLLFPWFSDFLLSRLFPLSSGNNLPSAPSLYLLSFFFRLLLSFFPLFQSACKLMLQKARTEIFSVWNLMFAPLSHLNFSRGKLKNKFCASCLVF